MTSDIALKLIKWFEMQKRSLPWRENISPYKVWVSEVMLQQTQVKTVIPYFNRWMEALPTIESLAQAPLEQVIKLWEGLGYYSRARNLRLGAQDLVKNYNAKLPKDFQKLLNVRGIGPYTAAAILSFAFHQKCPLIDGNVKRVISRCFNLALDFTKKEHYNQVENLLNTLLPEKKHWVFNEALMELGAMVCSPKKPNCIHCPINHHCQAKKLNKQLSLPLKKERKKTIPLSRVVLLFEHNRHILVQKQPSKIMKDLHEFYYFQCDPNQPLLEQYADNKFLQIKKSIQLPTVKHTYTNYKVTLYPILILLENKIEMDAFYWSPIDDLKTLAFSSGHRKIRRYLEDVFLASKDFNSQNLAYFSKV